MHVAVIGLGNIGGGVARNLARAGHRVAVFDVDPARIDRCLEVGAVASQSSRDAAIGARVVFTSLPGPREVSAVALGNDGTAGLLTSMSPGSVWVDLSTNDLETARSLDAVAGDVRLVDAPVSGGPEGAEAGTLSIFVGGDPGAVADVWPLLDVIGSKVDHLGGRGAGIVAKIAQVTLCYTQTVALTEALVLGVRGGVDPATMLDVICHSAGRSYVSDRYGPEILAGTYDADFPLGHAAKDMRLAMELATSVGADLPHMARVAELYERAERIHGADSGHLLAARMIEDDNRCILHERRNEKGAMP